MKRNGFSDGIGLRLSRQALRVLRERGIFAQSSLYGFNISSSRTATWCAAWSQVVLLATSAAT